MTPVRGYGRDDLRITRITSAAPTPFDFAGTVYSNGWAVLYPNRWDGDRHALTRTERLGPGYWMSVEESIEYGIVGKLVHSITELP